MFDCPAEESMKCSLHECLSAGLWKVDTIGGSREGPYRRPTPKTDPQKPPPMREACLPSCKVLCYTNCCEPESCSKQQRTCMCPAAEMHACHKHLCLLLCSGQFGQLSHTKPCFVSRFRSNHITGCACRDTQASWCSELACVLLQHGGEHVSGKFCRRLKVKCPSMQWA